jgi:predicted amidohydrolase YtcJ
LAESVSQYAVGRPGNTPVVVKGATHTMIRPDATITRHDLDRILGNRPLILVCFDHHTVWANTRALEAAGLLKGRALPTGNEIVIGEDGLATGELREAAAFAPVLALTQTGGREWLGMTTGEDPVPAATPAHREADLDCLRRGLAYCASLGITSIHNMDGNWYQLELLKTLEDAGELNLRVDLPFHQKNTFALSRLDEAVEMRRRFATDKLHVGRVKVFMDGVLESMTALMLDDYPGSPGNRGKPLFEADAFNEIAIRADALGLRISTHAIGDGGVRRTLDGYEAARRANGPRDSRHRIEHIEVIDPADVPRFRELGVIASMQPVVGLGVPGALLEPCLTRIGSKLPWSYAWQTLRDAGAFMAFSSDWPISPLNPFLGMQCAMTQQPLTRDCPPQAQSLADTLHAFTLAGAYAEFAESHKGMLRQGCLADVVVLDTDLEKVAPEAIGATKPVLTICDGRITFAAR